MSEKKDQILKFSPANGQIPVTDARIEGFKNRLNALMNEPHSETRLSELERHTLESLAGYLVHEHGTSEETIWQMVFSTFKVNDKQDLAGRDYNDIVGFLLDLNPKYAIN